MSARATKKPGKTRKTASVEYDDATVDRIVSEVEAAVVAGRGAVTYPRKGRPSLTGRPTSSPSVGFRVTPELRAQAEDVAERKGVSVSALAREALDEYVRKAG
ncbi:MAG: hypothetical protein ACKOE2_03260 [Actinomycetales bacterium]